MVRKVEQREKDIRTLIICHIVGFLLLVGFGAIAHSIARAFPNVVTRILLPNNLSLWEQGKIVVTPIFIIFTIEYFIVGKRFKNFIPAHLLIAFALPMLTYGVYHVHGFLFGNGLSLEGAHIVLSIAIILIAFLASYLLITSRIDLSKYTKLLIVLYIAMWIAYIVFSFVQPRWETFFDSINETFGPAFMK